LYGGGPLQPNFGASLSTKLKNLANFIGATENGWHHHIVGDNKLWGCLRFADGIWYSMEEVSPGLYELIIVKDANSPNYQGIFHVFPELDQYRTRDLFEENQEAKGWYI
jgi:hypothetical protein